MKHVDSMTPDELKLLLNDIDIQKEREIRSLEFLLENIKLNTEAWIKEKIESYEQNVIINNGNFCVCGSKIRNAYSLHKSKYTCDCHYPTQME